MSVNNLKQIDILKAEISFLVALWDKINPEQQNNASINLTYRNLESLKSIFENKKINLLSQDFDLWEDLLEEWRKWRRNSKPLQKIYGHAESLNSGIDKGSPKENVKVEPKEKRWVSNAFGSYKDKIIYLREDENQINTKIDNIKTKLEDFLNNTSPTYEEIHKIREIFKEFFLGLLSDDRYPINDITLWEQSYMPVCMFKALLANYLLNNRNFNNINNLSPKWKTLGIQYDKLGLMQKSLKLASIEWYRDIIEKIDNKIQKLIEFEIPLGNEIYRDNSGIYFLVGEDITDDLIKDKIYEIFEEKLKNELYPYIKLTEPSRGIMSLGTLLEEAKVNFLKAKIKNTPWLDEDKAIGICPICQMRFVTKDDLDKANNPPICKECDNRIHHYQVQEWKRDGETIWIDEISSKNRVALVSLKFDIDKWLNGDLLNSLLVRNEDYSNIKQNVLNFFNDIKAIQGFNIQLQSNIQEILSLYDKSILQIYSRLTNSIRTLRKILHQPINNLNQRELKLKEIFFESLSEFLFIENKSLSEWENYISSNYSNANYDSQQRRFINQNIFDDNNFVSFLKNIFSVGYVILQIKAILIERSIGDKWEEFIKNNLSDNEAINFENRKIIWNKLNESDLEFLSKLLLQFLLRKNPSPARLRRVWETTQDFFEKIEENILDDLEIPKWKRKRLVFSFDGTISKDKEFKNGDLQFWAEKDEQKVYLITSIEEFLLKFGNEEIKKFIKEKKDDELNDILNNNDLKNYLAKDYWEIEEYFKNQNKEKINLDLNDFRTQSYKPYISITKPSPKGWQFIIPIKNITNFIDKIKNRYDGEFKYVYGKLPLHIGIVVQKSKKPFYVGLKALRNMQEYNKEFYPIKTSEFCLEHNRKISLENNLERVNNPKNYYSLYWNSLSNESYKFFINPKENIKSLSTLDKFRDNDRLYFIPNTIDFEYLDTNSRRNDIYYKNGKRAVYLKQNRPYSWEEFEKFKNFRDEFKDKSNQLQALVSLIYSKMEDWKRDEESFKIFMQSTFKQRGLNIKDFGMSDFGFREIEKFLDMFEFWHTTLKEI